MATAKPGQMGQTRAPALSREADVREEAREAARCFFKKKEEPGSKFKCNYSGHGKSASQVFDDKNLELKKQNGWGGGGKKLPKNWADREKA